MRKENALTSTYSLRTAACRAAARRAAALALAALLALTCTPVAASRALAATANDAAGATATGNAAGQTTENATGNTNGIDTFDYPDVFGSPTHVRRVFLNLVENCIKYNKPGGTVHCSAGLLGVKGDVATYRFVVADTGIGMTPEFLEHIFEPFTQAHRQQNASKSSRSIAGMNDHLSKPIELEVLKRTLAKYRD